MNIYSSMDRHSSRKDTLPSTETYTYDNNGNLATVTDFILKKLIGAKGLRIYWYFLGGIVLMIGLVGVILGLGDLFVHLGIVPR